MVLNFILFLLLVYFVFSGVFITESLASAVTTTDSTGTASTVENKNVSVNGPDTTLYDSATQEILTNHQCLTAGNGSGELILQHSIDTVTPNIKTTKVCLETEVTKRFYFLNLKNDLD